MTNILKHRFIVIVFSLALLLIQASSQYQLDSSLTATAESLPYQAHSFNDLNYTRNLMMRKTKYFKFDASMANKASCQQYSTWKGQNTCFNSSFFAQEMCCIAMRGDASSQPNFKHFFNTSNQFVSLLDQFLASFQSQIDILFVAIDIQFSFQFKNKIAEDFIYALAQLLQKYKKLHVTVKGDFVLQYDTVCKHSSTSIYDLTNRVGEQACTPQRKLISNSPFFLQSGSNRPDDSRDYKGRFKNFNIIYKEIDRLCKDGFPTWMNKYPQYPLIFWEPSNEDQILSSLKKLMNPTCANKHNRTINGIAFASNIDPEMFSVYMKSFITDKAFPWNFSQNKLWMQFITSMKIAKLTDVSDGAKTSSKDRLVVYWQIKVNGTTKNILNTLIMDDQSQQISLYKAIELDEQIISLHGLKDNIVVVMKTTVNQMASKQQDVIFVSYNSLLQMLNTRAIASYISSYSSKNYIYYITRTSMPTYFNLYSIEADLKSPQQYGVSNYMPHQQIDSISSIYFLKTDSFQTDIFLVFGNVDDQTWIAQIKNGNIHKSKILTFGTNAKIAIKQDNKILILLQNSYSHSGLLLNNNAQNKCMLHKNQKLQSLAHIPNLINVLQATIEQYMQFLNADDSQILTACHPNIQFSKFMIGSQSQITSVWNQVFITTKFIPLNKQDLMSSLFIGGSNYQSELKDRSAFLLTSVNANNLLKSQSFVKFGEVK